MRLQSETSANSDFGELSPSQRFEPRAGQREILAYQGGLLGVSAVPGSGKTAAIVALATRLIAERQAEGGQVLIVTYQNAAVDNVRGRIGQHLQEMDMLQIGYDVRTLHSLAYGIVQANPGLVGAATEFVVLDERASESLLDKAVRAWNDDNKGVWGRLGPGEYVDPQWEQEWRDIARKVARTVITTAKNRRLRAEDLLARIGGVEDRNQFLRIGAEIYRLYQQQVETIGGLDFDDLVWMAVEMLQQYPDLCSRYRRRWPFVLEDEAQDSVPFAGGADRAVGRAGRQLDPGRRPQSGDYEHLHRGRSALFARLFGARRRRGRGDDDLWPLRSQDHGLGQLFGRVGRGRTSPS